MAACSPVEDILYKLAAWLLANVPTYLDTIEAERADGIALADPAKYEVSDADPFGQTQYPVVLIYPTDAPIEADIDTGHDEIALSAEILIAISDGDAAEGTKRALRYAEAVREIIRDDRSMAAYADLITVKRIIYYATDPEQLSLRLVQVSVEIRKTVSHI